MNAKLFVVFVVLKKSDKTGFVFKPSLPIIVNNELVNYKIVPRPWIYRRYVHMNHIKEHTFNDYTVTYVYYCITNKVTQNRQHKVYFQNKLNKRNLKCSEHFLIFYLYIDLHYVGNFKDTLSLMVCVTILTHFSHS